MIDLGPKMLPKWTPKSTSNDPRSTHGAPRGSSWEPKGPQDPSQGLLGLPKPHFWTISWLIFINLCLILGGFLVTLHQIVMIWGRVSANLPELILETPG